MIDNQNFGSNASLLGGTSFSQLDDLSNIFLPMTLYDVNISNKDIKQMT